MEPTFLLESEATIERPEDLNRKKWSDDLREFIKKLLIPIMPGIGRAPRSDKERKDNRALKEKQVRRYLSNHAMKIWEAAFTHASFDPRRDYNYERLEFAGDRVLKYTFNKYIMRRFPELDEDGLTGVETTYMAKDFQPRYAKRLNLDKHVLLIGLDRAPRDIQEDLFESFIGALSEVSDDLEDGLGAVNVYNFIVHFFNRFEFDLKGGLGGKAKTLVRQIFERFDKSFLEGIQEWVIGDDGIGTFTVKATPKVMDFLSSKEPGHGFGIKLKSPILGQAKGVSEKATGKLAYQNAFKTLESYGITPREAELMKQMQDFLQPSILPYKPMLEKKLREDGFVRSFFDEPNVLRTNERVTILFVGERRSGEHVRLGNITVAKGADDIAAKEDLIKDYLAEERIRPSVRTKPERKKPERRKPERKKAEKPEERKPERRKPERKKPPRKKPEPEPEPAEEVEEAPSRAEREETLNGTRVPELKAILREKKLKVGGRKAELIERILDAEF